jgi:heat shock protein HtpX
MYELIAKNKRNSLALFSIETVILIVLGYFVGVYLLNDAVLGIIIAVTVSVVMGLMAYYNGDSIIMTISRAKRIQKKDARQLWNVIEELSIASGLPMPKIYIINDSAPNAFATGRDPKHASVAITSGLIDKLNRDELQGVMAHEMSHIQNRDILFCTMIAIMVGAIVMFADFFLRAMFLTGGGRRRRSSSSSKGNPMFFVIAIVFAILAPLLAQIIQFAVSRQREYLADASAAKMTRNPLGLANALKKIADDPEPLEAANRGTQHLYIVNPLKKAKQKSGILDTHPPVWDRINRLEKLQRGGVK